MHPTYRNDEEVIVKAKASLRGKRCTNVASLARRFGVSESRLRAGLQNRPSKLRNQNMPTRLTEKQDLALIVTVAAKKGQLTPKMPLT
jgi:transposase-like protein